jgi:hypothetical protein
MKALADPENTISSWSELAGFLNFANYKFQKNKNKYMDVASCIHYDRENFQYKISCCVGSRKRQMNKVWKN